MFIHNQVDSVYEVNRKQDREIKSLKSEVSRMRDRASSNYNQANTAEHSLRKARRTIEMQEAQMANMQKNSEIGSKAVAHKNELIHELRKDVDNKGRLINMKTETILELQSEARSLRSNRSIKSSTNTYIPIERYNKLEAKKDLFKKALAAELDGESSSHIIDILTEEAPKSNEYSFDMESKPVGTIRSIEIRNSHNTWW